MNIHMIVIYTIVFFLVDLKVTLQKKFKFQNDAGFIRSTRYHRTVINKICLLKPEQGPCRANIQMYYYDPPTITCGNFSWGGCQGNGNRFDTLDECITSCLSQPNPPPKAPRWCSLRFDYGYCFGAIKRYYFDPLWKTCKESIYSGCGGNRNNFYSQDQCDQVCRFGKTPVRLGKVDKLDGLKKVLIVNPYHLTTKTRRTTSPSSFLRDMAMKSQNNITADATLPAKESNT